MYKYTVRTKSGNEERVFADGFTIDPEEGGILYLFRKNRGNREIVSAFCDVDMIKRND